RLVRRNRAYLPAICRDTVGTRQEADDLHRFECRRPWIDRISADIADDLGFEGTDPTIQLEAQFRFDNLIEAVARRHQVLCSASGPAHCATEMTGQDGDKDLFLIQGCLAAETATDIRSDDTHTVSRHV